MVPLVQVIAYVVHHALSRLVEAVGMPCAVRHDQQVQAGGPALGLEYDGPDFDRSAVREQAIPGHVIGGQGLEPAKTWMAFR